MGESWAHAWDDGREKVTRIPQSIKNAIEEKTSRMKVSKIVANALPTLRGSIFLSILAVVFIFYFGIIIISVFLLLISIWL